MLGSRYAVLFERAKSHILSVKLGTYIRKKELSDVALHYYSALDYYEMQLFYKKLDLSLQKSRVLKDNHELMMGVRSEIENEDLFSSLANYSDGFVLGALTSLIRDTEANVLTYERHQKAVQKFNSFAVVGFSSKIIEESWKETDKSIIEITSWLIGKANLFFPTISKLIEINSRKRVQCNQNLNFLRESHSDEEILYIIAGSLLYNPFLNHRIITKIEKMSNFNYTAFKRILEDILVLITKETNDELIKRKINLFFSHPSYKKPSTR